jgi:hypothetical protein
MMILMRGKRPNTKGCEEMRKLLISAALAAGLTLTATPADARTYHLPRKVRHELAVATKWARKQGPTCNAWVEDKGPDTEVGRYEVLAGCDAGPLHVPRHRFPPIDG